MEAITKKDEKDEKKKKGKMEKKKQVITITWQSSDERPYNEKNASKVSNFTSFEFECKYRYSYSSLIFRH